MKHTKSTISVNHCFRYLMSEHIWINFDHSVAVTRSATDQLDTSDLYRVSASATTMRRRNSELKCGQGTAPADRCPAVHNYTACFSAFCIKCFSMVEFSLYWIKDKSKKSLILKMSQILLCNWTIAWCLPNLSIACSVTMLYRARHYRHYSGCSCLVNNAHNEYLKTISLSCFSLSSFIMSGIYTIIIDFLFYIFSLIHDTRRIYM